MVNVLGIETVKDLFDAMRLPTQIVAIRGSNDKMGVIGYLQSIQREDGSGKCFNVTLQTTNSGKLTTIFFRGK